MPNPFKINVAHPDEEAKAQLATIFNWLEVVYTDEPYYNSDTQYLTSCFTGQDGKAVQVWELREIGR